MKTWIRLAYLVPALGLLSFAARAEEKPAGERKASSIEKPGGPYTVVAPHAITPGVAVDGAGGVYVACFDREKKDFVLAVSRDGGETFDPPVVAIATGGRGAAGMQRGPRAGVDGTGAIYVSACLDLDPPGDKSPGSDVLLAVSTDGGKTFGKPARVNDVPRSAPEMYNALAVAPSGVAHLAWLDLRYQADRGLGQMVYTATVTRNGKGELSAGKNVQVYVSPKKSVCECCNVAIAVDRKGNPAIAFRNSLPDGTRDCYLTVSPDGGKSFRPTGKLGRGEWRTNCPMEAPAIAGSPDGGVLAVAWMDRRAAAGGDANVYRVQVPGGFAALPPYAAREAEAMVHNSSPAAQSHPALAVDRQGTVITVWEDSRPGWQAIVGSSTADSGRNFLLSDEAEGKASYPAVASGEKGTVVVYEARGEVHLRKFGGSQKPE